MKRTALLFIVAILPASGAKKPKPQPPAPIVMHDERSDSGSGEFTFTKLVLTPNILPYVGLSGYKINGLITNTTPHGWRYAAFTLRFLDATGKAVETIPLSYINLKKGDSQALMTITDFPVSFILGSPDGGFRISFDRGDMDIAYKFRMNKPVPSETTAFDDQAITAIFSVSEDGIDAGILNKTDAPIKLDWNRASIIDPSGTSHPVTHQGVKYADATAVKPPTIIPPTAKVTDVLVEADRIHFSSGDWHIDPLFQRTRPDANKGATIGVFLPLEINGAIKNYTFQFEVTDVIF